MKQLAEILSGTAFQHPRLIALKLIPQRGATSSHGQTVFSLHLSAAPPPSLSCGGAFMRRCRCSTPRRVIEQVNYGRWSSRQHAWDNDNAADEAYCRSRRTVHVLPLGIDLRRGAHVTARIAAIKTFHSGIIESSRNAKLSSGSSFFERKYPQNQNISKSIQLYFRRFFRKTKQFRYRSVRRRMSATNNAGRALRALRELKHRARLHN